MAGTTGKSSYDLTRHEYGLLVDSVNPSGVSILNPRIILAFNLLVGAIIISWSIYAGNYRLTGAGAVILLNALWLCGLIAQRGVAAGVIRKLQGDPTRGRRAIDTAIHHELAG